jgi:WD40 repeat protein
MPLIKLSSILLLLSILAGCANLQPAQPATYVFENAHIFASTAIAFSPDSKQIASGGFKGEITLWSVENHRSLASLKSHTDTVRGLQFISPQQLISIADDGYLMLWDIRTERPLRSVKSTPIMSVGVLEGSIITGHRDGFLRSWRLSDMTLLKELQIDSASIIALTLHQNKIAAATSSGKVAVYDTQFNLKQLLQERGTVAHDLKFNPDGTKLAAGTWFKLMLWDTQTGTLNIIPTEHNGLLTSLDFSPDGKYLVSLGRHTDSAIRLWNTQNLTVERRYEAHEWCGYMIRFSLDSKFMASVSDDESVRLYNLTEPYRPR